MAAAQDGDRAAYESLLVALVPVLRAFAGRRGVAPAQVEDVVQEVLLLLHRARHTWRPERPFAPWLWAIARNASTDALRRQTRDRSRRDETPGLRDEPASEDPGPEELLRATEFSPRLAAALSALPDAQREAIELLYLQQLPVAEAAARAGVTETALKVRAHRGTRALRTRLGTREPS